MISTVQTLTAGTVPVRWHKSISWPKIRTSTSLSRGLQEGAGEEDHISLILRAPVAGPACQGPAQCMHLPCSIKGRMRSLEHKGKGNKSIRFTRPKLSQAIQHTSGRRVLRPCGPNHSKSSCLSRVHLFFGQAFLDLPQTHPKLGLGGCIPPPG
jgi:hypothetical protein